MINIDRAGATRRGSGAGGNPHHCRDRDAHTGCGRLRWHGFLLSDAAGKSHAAVRRQQAEPEMGRRVYRPTTLPQRGQQSRHQPSPVQQAADLNVFGQRVKTLAARAKTVQ